MALALLLTGVVGSPAWAAEVTTTPAATAATVATKKVTYKPEDKARYEALREQNAGQLAPKERFITTTAQDIVLTFGGLIRRESVDDMLDHLDAMDAKGTFFVTELELRKHADTVREILQRGHEIGLGLRTGTEGNFYETCAQIERLRKNMNRLFGVKPTIARQVFGKEMPEVNEACSAMGIELLGQTVNTVQTKDKEAKTAEDIYSHLFGKAVTSMGRGQIIYTRLDFLDHPLLTGQVLDWIKKNKIDNISYETFSDSPDSNAQNDSFYRLCSAGEVLKDTAHYWTYPVSEESVPYALRVDTPTGIDGTRNFEQEFQKRYIGSPKVTEIDRVRGFSQAERNQMDKSGVVKNVTDRTIFLTFDDWSNDKSINHILYVLRKHHVPATFFIITWNVKNNPNLLRTIAEEGHNIASHTHSHRPMVAQDATYGGNMVPMTDAEYAEDVKKAYRELVSVVGDVQVDGKPMLTRFIRPPTLAISKTGVRNILNAGYTYIVSGYESTEDYAAPSMQALVGGMQHGIYDEKGEVRKGSILIMHMTDAAKYTAEALDELLTVNEQRDENDPKKFKVGRLSDYLTDGYDQSAAPMVDFEKKLVYQAACCR